ncbi:transposable element Tc3 transposase [Trichonephila clavipes]|nr:transposable element Tc3 transposase [Trichonephila clavipes]
MGDNARPHRANIVGECLQLEDITRMDWRAYSPDFNPIEHVWNMLGRRIAARQPHPTSLPELRRALLDEWCNIPQDQIDNLILSMPRRYFGECCCMPKTVDLLAVKDIIKSHLGEVDRLSHPMQERQGHGQEYSALQAESGVQKILKY